MVYRNWKQPKSKEHYYDNKNLKREQKHKDEINSAKKDEETLKRKIRRLTIDWFFRPRGD